MAGKNDWVRINRDDLRNMRGDYWVPKQEKIITMWEQQCLIAALAHNMNVVYDSTNLNPKNIKEIEKIVESCNSIKKEENRHTIEYKVFNTPLETCLERDAARERTVGPMVIKGFYNRYKDVLDGK